MPQRVTLLALTAVPHKHRSPHARTPPPALVFLLIEVIEPGQQIAQPLTGKERSLLQPVIKPLRHGHHASPASRRRYRDLKSPAHAVGSAHPSPTSADHGFFGCRPFSRANDLLMRQWGQPVDWRLP
ncbi:hypothetical protein SSP24_27020 [Streptomyces spinoverrucosus]|uniref:Uncharacterized protein n=1 Tax=Streptomyces spinoverrucosus TaxID=284043 RepID=A0A4Y3VDP0_9ACTN|nr:hypothetical protein SSP24_27020 [Streptomyces spinoverrucosus]GHB71556.1 hypothetical protein GCM10010397_47180 [Streptomyces spinoverrucosus]